MHRLFVALRPPPEIRSRLATTMLGVPRARWQDDAQLHLTLRFIGTVDRPVAEDIAAALAGVSAVAPRVALAGVGRFEHRGKTDTLWVGLAPHDALAALHQKVDRALVQAGVAPDLRKYLPHISVARLARGAGVEPEVERWVAVHAGLASPTFEMAHLVLYESRLSHGGSAYEAVARWPLATNS